MPNQMNKTKILIATSPSDHHITLFLLLIITISHQLDIPDKSTSTTSRLLERWKSSVCLFDALLRCCTGRRVPTSEWIMTLSRLCRLALGPPSQYSNRRDSGNCLIGLGALLRRIKQSKECPDLGIAAASRHFCPEPRQDCPQAPQS